MKFLLKWLLNHFLFAGTMFFAAADVAVTGGGDAATQNSDGTGQVADVDDTADTRGSESDGADSESQESAEAVSAEKPETQPAKLDSRTLPPSVKSAMAELQKTDPKAHAWLKDRLWAEKRFRDTVPGGLAEVQKMQSAIAELGQGPIEQVIASVKEELSEGRALDELFANGDLQSLERMIEFAPEGFKKLLPAAIAKYPQLDPEGYQRYGAGLIDRSLAESGITPSLKFMARLIEKGDVEGAKAELAAVLETMKGFGELARSQPKKVEANPEADQRAKNIEDREWKLWLNETAGPINAAKTQAIKAELKQYTKDQQIDEETYEALEAQCLRYVDALLKSDPNFGPTFSSYIENRDREGLTKFMQSKLKEILPSKSGKMGPVEKAYKLFFRGAPKAQPKVGQKPGQQVQKPVPKGWEKVAKAPEPAEIDMNQSPFEMRFGKAAVLKNGKKVFWGDQAPASA